MSGSAPARTGPLARRDGHPIGPTWRLTALLGLTAVVAWLTGCAAGGSDGSGAGACPPVVTYTTAEQVRAAREVEALPEGAMLVRMLSDYAVLRDQARACG